MRHAWQIIVKNKTTNEIEYVGTTIYLRSKTVFSIVDDMNYDYERNNSNRTAFAKRCHILD